MLTITITIGRNIKSIPMAKHYWISFQAEIKRLFDDLYVDAENQGVWGGVKEESRVFVGTTKHSIEYLESFLKGAAREYQQDAIGFMVNSRKTSLVDAA